MDVTSSVAALHHVAAVVELIDKAGVSPVVVSDLILALVLIIIPCDMHVITSGRLQHILLHEFLIRLT